MKKIPILVFISLLFFSISFSLEKSISAGEFDKKYGESGDLLKVGKDKEMFKNLFLNTQYSTSEFKKLIDNTTSNINQYENQLGILKSLALLAEYSYHNNQKAFDLYKFIAVNYSDEEYYALFEAIGNKEYPTLRTGKLIYPSQADSKYNLARLSTNNEDKIKYLQEVIQDQNIKNTYYHAKNSGFYVSYIDAAIRDLVELQEITTSNFNEYEKDSNNIIKDILLSKKQKDLTPIYKYIHTNISHMDMDDMPEYDYKEIKVSLIYKTGTPYWLLKNIINAKKIRIYKQTDYNIYIEITNLVEKNEFPQYLAFRKTDNNWELIGIEDTAEFIK